MKAHSFVRENVPRVLAWVKDKTSMQPANIIDLFLFLSTVFL